jgi:hypothetical protein
MDFLANMKFFGGELMNNKIIGFVALLAFSMLLSVPSALAIVVDNPGNGPPGHLNDGTVGVIHVTSDDTDWYTIVPYAGGTLVYNGHNGVSFQPIGAEGTPYGPGDVGYRAGRWWVDLNGNHEMDPEGEDHYFLCPLTLKAPGTQP